MRLRFHKRLPIFLMFSIRENRFLSEWPPNLNQAKGRSFRLFYAFAKYGEVAESFREPQCRKIRSMVSRFVKRLEHFCNQKVTLWMRFRLCFRCSAYVDEKTSRCNSLLLVPRNNFSSFKPFFPKSPAENESFVSLFSDLIYLV